MAVARNGNDARDAVPREVGEKASVRLPVCIVAGQRLRQSEAKKEKEDDDTKKETK